MRVAAYAFRTAVLTILLVQSLNCLAGELIVLSSGAARSAVSVLVPMFEKAAGQKASVRFANNPLLEKIITEGARFDVLIIEPDYIERLSVNGHIAPGSRIDLARVGMALGARAGTPAVDTSSVKGFVHVLQAAESIAYTADGHSGMVFLRTLERLGLADAMKEKLRPAVGRTASSLVLAGDAQMWAGPISTPAKGAQVIGRFPEEVQTYIGISAAVASDPSNRDTGSKLVAFLASPEAASVFAAKGFHPVAMP
jgi:molybdate transport system substrate-binding protein